MVQAIPGSLPEGAAERSEAEGVSPDGSSGPMVTRKPLLALKFLTVCKHQSTPPQNRSRGNIPYNVNHPPAGCFASGRVIFRFYVGEVFCHSSGCLRNRGGAGDFHRPYEGSETVSFYHSTGYTPSVSRSLDSSLREGAGNGCVPFNVLPKNRNVAGDFHRPYGSYVSPFIGGQVNDCFCGGVWYNVGKNRKRVAYAGIY